MHLQPYFPVLTALLGPFKLGTWQIHSFLDISCCFQVFALGLISSVSFRFPGVYIADVGCAGLILKSETSVFVWVFQQSYGMYCALCWGLSTVVILVKVLDLEQDFFRKKAKGSD